MFSICQFPFTINLLFFTSCHSHISVSCGSLLSPLFVYLNLFLGKPLILANQLRYFATVFVKVYLFSSRHLEMAREEKNNFVKCLLQFLA